MRGGTCIEGVGAPEGLVVHALVGEQVVLQVELPQVGQAVEGSSRDPLQLVVLRSEQQT